MLRDATFLEDRESSEVSFNKQGEEGEKEIREYNNNMVEVMG